MDRKDALGYYLLLVAASWVAFPTGLILTQSLSSQYGEQVLAFSTVLAVVSGAVGVLVYYRWPTKQASAPEVKWTLTDPAGIENLTPLVRDMLAEKIQQLGELRIQVLYVKAVNADLRDCEAKVSVEGDILHMFWEGIGKGEHGVAKETVTIKRDDEKGLALWYAQRQNGKAALFIPTTIGPHVPHEIGNGLPPLEIDLWFFAWKFSEQKPHHFRIHRDSWENLRAEAGETEPKMVEAQLRLEPPVGIESIPEPERSRIIAEVIPKNGAIRSQQIYVKAINGDLTDCEVKIVVDNNGVDHTLWEGIRRQPPATGKDKVTIHRDDEKYFTLWYAHQKDGKELLYIPITTFPHMARYIGHEQSPLVVEIWIIAQGFSDKQPRRFIIYRESWEGLLAKFVQDRVARAEFDSNWHLSGDIQPAPYIATHDMGGSDKWSTVHLSHSWKTISVNGRMRGLLPFHEYQVKIRPPYVTGGLIPTNEIGDSRTTFTTNISGEAVWSFNLSPDELANARLERFSLSIEDVPNKATVLISDNISYHN